MNDLTLVLPVKNEPESLPFMLMEIEKLNLNYIIVMEKNDFITLNSIEKFKSKIVFQENKGYGDALLDGLQAVKTKYFLFINGDGSMDPNETSEFYKDITHKNLDLLFATRY